MSGQWSPERIASLREAIAMESDPVTGDPETKTRLQAILDAISEGAGGGNDHA